MASGDLTPRVLVILIAFLIGGSLALAQTDRAPACHHTNVDERGDHVMGFDYTKTSHHFLLSRSGGSIEASANDSDDSVSRDAIRGHFKHIAAMFSEGNFDAPMLIHDRIPPGAPTMKNKKTLIEWKFEETRAGGRIRITTRDAEALAATHEFLRFQIEDHRTGDPTEAPPEPDRKN